MDSMIPVANRQPGRLWAVLQFPLVRFVIAFVALFLWLFAATVGSRLGGVQPFTPLSALISVVVTVGLLVIYALYVLLLERREVVELASKGAQRHVTRGMLVGAALFCSVMLVLRLFGAWDYTGTYALSVMAYPFVINLLAAVLEEILFRGLLFRMLEESLGSWIALGLAALLFGVAHAGNPGIGALKATAVITLEAGVLLAAAYMYARSLWFVIGLHFAWNFTEGGVFATSVSGTRPEGVIGVRFSGPELLTGGGFGPEGSLPAVLIGLATGIVFVVLAARSGRIVRPFWTRQR